MVYRGTYFVLDRLSVHAPAAMRRTIRGVIPGLLSARLMHDSDNSMQVGRGVNTFVQ
jgi:hypothetical protein